MKKPTIHLLSHDIMLQSVHEAHQRVLERQALLDEARRQRDDLIYDAKDMQIPVTRIAKVTGIQQANLIPIFRKVERRRNGVTP